MAPAASLQRATIVGAGRMGLGIAESFVIASLDVTFADATPELCLAARERLIYGTRGRARAGMIEVIACG